jgi:hypothetical protein
VQSRLGSWTGVRRTVKSPLTENKKYEVRGAH